MNLGDGCNDEDGREARSSAHFDLHIVSATCFFSSLFLLYFLKKKRQEENSEREKIII
jgi:hypothetical protein